MPCTRLYNCTYDVTDGYVGKLVWGKISGDFRHGVSDLLHLEWTCMIRGERMRRRNISKVDRKQAQNAINILLALFLILEANNTSCSYNQTFLNMCLIWRELIFILDKSLPDPRLFHKHWRPASFLTKSNRDLTRTMVILSIKGLILPTWRWLVNLSFVSRLKILLETAPWGWFLQTC